MSARLEADTSFTQSSPTPEVPAQTAVDVSFITDLIAPFSQPLYPLTDWELAGEQRFIDDRARLLTEASAAYIRGDRYMAKAYLRLVYEDAIHSIDIHKAEYDESLQSEDTAPHKVALWLLQEAIHIVDLSEQPVRTVGHTAIKAVA